MEMENNFAVNDIIYFLYQNKITKRPIVDMHINNLTKSYKVLFANVVVMVHQDDAFKTINDLIYNLNKEFAYNTLYSDETNSIYTNDWSILN